MRGGLLSLALVELPLRERPVVICGSMDEDDLDQADVSAATPDETAGGANNALAQVKAFDRVFESFFQALRQRARARSAAARSSTAS